MSKKLFEKLETVTEFQGELFRPYQTSPIRLSVALLEQVSYFLIANVFGLVLLAALKYCSDEDVTRCVLRFACQALVLVTQNAKLENVQIFRAFQVLSLACNAKPRRLNEGFFMRCKRIN